MTTFISADAAMIWFANQTPPYQGDAAEIFRALNDLYVQRVLKLDHILVIRHYGRRGEIPQLSRMREMKAYDLWRTARAALEPRLEKYNIIKKDQRVLA